MSRYQKGKTNLDFTEARNSEWQWHQLGCMQVRTSLQTDSQASTPPLSFLQAKCPSCRPTNSVEALKAKAMECGLIMSSKNKRQHLAHLVSNLGKFVIGHLRNAIVVVCPGRLWILYFRYSLTLSATLQPDELRYEDIHQRCIHPAHLHTTAYSHLC